MTDVPEKHETYGKHNLGRRQTGTTMKLARPANTPISRLSLEKKVSRGITS